MLTNEPDEKLQYACCVDNVGRKPNMQYDPPPQKKPKKPKKTPKKTKKNNNIKLTHTETHNILWKPKKQHGPYEVMSNTTVRSK